MLATAPVTAQTHRGVNLAGAEFGANRMGRSNVHGKDYIYPSAQEVQAFRDMGMNLFRIPVRWERLQPALGGGLHGAEMARLDNVIEQATEAGATVIIDIHNYARYRGALVGSEAVPVEAFLDLWRLLARRYARQPKVAFGLMNEPHGISATAWADIAQQGLLAIRAAGARNLVLVPGTAWTGAHSWRKRVSGGVSNAEALRTLRDPANNMAIEFHQYFDGNSSGTQPRCVAPEVVERRLAIASTWLRDTGHRGFLGEFGGSSTPECLAALRAALTHVERERGWMGWTYWASSRWFGNYELSVYPFQETPPPQLDVLKDYLTPAAQ
jgi:endoglucanase